MTAASRFAHQIQRFKRRRFLLVDDFADFRHVLKKTLEEFGALHIDSASSADEALNLFRRQPYDVVIADYNLGEGKDGQQLLEELINAELLRPDAAYVMLTAENAASLVLGALENRPDDYLTKPFNKPTLLTRLDRTMERKELLAPLQKALQQCAPEQVPLLSGRVAQQYPRLAPAIIRLCCEHLMRAGAVTTAAKLLGQISSQQPQGWVLCGLAWCALKNQQPQQAMDLCQQVLELNPDSVDAFELRAEALLQSGDKDAAFIALQEAAKRSPRSLTRQRRLAQLARQQGDWPVAYRAAKRAVELSPQGRLGDAEDLALLAEALFMLAEQGDTRQKRRMNDEISALLQANSKRQGGSPAIDWTVQALRMRQLVKRDKTDEALALWNDLKPLLPLFCAVQLQALIRHLLSTLESIEPTICQQLEQWLQSQQESTDSSDNALADNRIGLYCYQQGDLELAVQAFNIALQQRPDSANIALNLLQASLKLATKRNLENAEQQSCQRALAVGARLSSHDSRYSRFVQLQAAAPQLFTVEEPSE